MFVIEKLFNAVNRLYLSACVKQSWPIDCFLPGIFMWGKIYCCVNFCIVLDPNFVRGESFRGRKTG